MNNEVNELYFFCESEITDEIDELLCAACVEQFGNAEIIEAVKGG